MKYYASGKLLLFGEYLVLRGAECLAIPLKYGQSMEVTNRSDDQFHWLAKTKEDIWFLAVFSKDLEIMETSNSTKANRLIELLTFLKTQTPDLFREGLFVETSTNFGTEWGFGTSSTLVSLLAQWTDVDPYRILEKSFGGSGYDVACANADSPIVYKADSQKTQEVDLAKAVTSNILFVYSGKKQESKSEVSRFSTLEIAPESIEKMDQIVASAVKATEIETFEKAMKESEKMLSQILKLPRIKEENFKDYPFAIKSLGAWGGDFFMATFRDEEEARSYFKERGFEVQFTYKELIKA